MLMDFPNGCCQGGYNNNNIMLLLCQKYQGLCAVVDGWTTLYLFFRRISAMTDRSTINDADLNVNGAQRNRPLKHWLARGGTHSENSHRNSGVVTIETEKKSAKRIVARLLNSARVAGFSKATKGGGNLLPKT